MIRYVLRRLLLIPFMFGLTVIMLALVPVVAILQSLSVLAMLWGSRPRWRSLRLSVFAAIYTVGECCCLLVCFALWLSSPLPRWRDHQRWQARHAGVIRRFLDVLVRAGEWAFGFRLSLQSPTTDTTSMDLPLVVLGRHAGPGASFVLVHVLLRDRGRVPHIVLKSQLRLDPALDVLLSRLGSAFLARGRAGDSPTDAVRTLASALQPGDALVLFPEGSDWTPTRHRMAVRRLHRQGLRRQARRAAAMPHVLPPRPAGTFAALQAAPTAEVAIFMHTGHDDLLDATSLWRALPLRRDLQMVWWPEPRPQLATEADCARWLNELWGRIDTWIGSQAEPPAVSA